MRQQAEFIARQLNDHEDNKRGARQGTFHTWSKPHILEALAQAASYLFTILPSAFSEIKTTKLPEASCYIQLSCCKVLDILGIGDCLNVTIEENQATNDLLGMLGSDCVTEESESYRVVRVSDNIFTSAEKLPANTEINYVCAEPPKDAESVDECILNEHDALITAFALWWLLLTDNESRTNLERADRYYQMVKDYVELKLLLEFSLNEDDYKFGRRRVND